MIGSIFKYYRILGGFFRICIGYLRDHIGIIKGSNCNYIGILKGSRQDLDLNNRIKSRLQWVEQKIDPSHEAAIYGSERD